MVRAARVAAVAGAVLLAGLGLAAQKGDKCSLKNLKACVDHEWNTPVEFSDKDLLGWQKAFRYAKWKSGADSANCNIFVESVGNAAFTTARQTKSRRKDDRQPFGGWVVFMLAEDPQIMEHMHGAFYRYQVKDDDGENYTLNIIVMNAYLTSDMFWPKLQHEVSHYGGLGDYTDPGAYGIEKCGKRDEKKENEDPDDVENEDPDGGGGDPLNPPGEDPGGNGGNGGNGGGGWTCEWHRVCVGVGGISGEGEEPGDPEDEPTCVWQCEWVQN